jgi:O-antigen/teichoic acid export membrane protein
MSSMNQILYAWCNRRRDYGRLASNRVLGAGVAAGAQIGTGLLNGGGGGLIMGLLTGQAVNAAGLGWRTWLRDRASLSCASKKGMREVARKYRNFPLYSLPAEFINVLTNQLPVLLLTYFASAASAGLYGLTQRVLGLPTTLIASSVVDVFKQRAAEDYVRNGNCREIFGKTFKGLVSLAIIPFALIFLLGPSLFALVFGEKWISAGEYARWLSIMYFLRFVSSPLSYVYLIAGRQKEDSLLHVYMALSTAGALWIAYHLSRDPFWMIAAFSLNYSFVYAIYLARSYGFAKGKRCQGNP